MTDSLINLLIMLRKIAPEEKKRNNWAFCRYGNETFSFLNIKI